MAKTKEVLAPAALDPEKMAESTREQQEAHVRMVPKICRGPLQYSNEDEQALFKKWYVFEAKDDFNGARKFILVLFAAAQKFATPGFRVSVPSIPEEDEWITIRRAGWTYLRVRGQLVGRACGWDLNEEIMRHKFDGAEHETECPICGTPHYWTGPVFY